MNPTHYKRLALAASFVWFATPHIYLMWFGRSGSVAGRTMAYVGAVYLILMALYFQREEKQ